MSKMQIPWVLGLLVGCGGGGATGGGEPTASKRERDSRRRGRHDASLRGRYRPRSRGPRRGHLLGRPPRAEPRGDGAPLRRQPVVDDARLHRDVRRGDDRAARGDHGRHALRGRREQRQGLARRRPRGHRPVAARTSRSSVLSSNIALPEYVVPVITPMTDHTRWGTSDTAIGYGADTTGVAGAGVRRIREDVGMVCIPNDPDFVDCCANTTAAGPMAYAEFASGDGLCEGDSGSSAFDQKSFDEGTWASFGVLSRGGVSADGMTCTGSIYTRFDAWASLIVETAVQAATEGGYAPPSWTATPLPAGGPSVTAGICGAPSTAGADGTTCDTDGQCASGTCVSHRHRELRVREPVRRRRRVPGGLHVRRQPVLLPSWRQRRAVRSRRVLDGRRGSGCHLDRHHPRSRTGLSVDAQAAQAHGAQVERAPAVLIHNASKPGREEALQ